MFQWHFMVIRNSRLELGLTAKKSFLQGACPHLDTGFYRVFLDAIASLVVTPSVSQSPFQIMTQGDY